MSYIDEIAREIHRRTDGPDGDPSPLDLALHRIYAVLCLSVGTAVTNEMVHDAWSAWRAASKPDHRSLVLFTELSVEVQEMDAVYRDAIRVVAAERVLAPDLGAA